VGDGWKCIRQGDVNNIRMQHCVIATYITDWRCAAVQKKCHQLNGNNDNSTHVLSLSSFHLLLLLLLLLQDTDLSTPAFSLY